MTRTSVEAITTFLERKLMILSFSYNTSTNALITIALHCEERIVPLAFHL